MLVLEVIERISEMKKSIKKYLNSIVQPSWENLRLQYIRAIILLYQIVSQVNLYIIDLEYKL